MSSGSMEARSKDELAHEFADVLICTFLLAEAMGVDLNDALRKKMSKIDKRFEGIKVE